MVLKESLDVLPNSYWGIRGDYQAARTGRVFGGVLFFRMRGVSSVVRKSDLVLARMVIHVGAGILQM